MEEAKKYINCKKKILELINNWHSTKSLDVIIDIYDEIRYSEMDKRKVKQKFFRILYNLKDSNSLYSILEEEDRETVRLFLNDFLGIQCDGDNYYISNEYFKDLSLDDFYQVLVETKYLKERENNNEKRLFL